MPVFQLIYCSRNSISSLHSSALSELRQILAVSQRNNGRDGITGFLIYDKTWITQILEGERTAVLATYDRIRADKRHSDIVKLSALDDQPRVFENWAMGGIIKDVDVQEVYLERGIDMSVDPRKLKPEQILSLAIGLNNHQIEKQADNARKRGVA